MRDASDVGQQSRLHLQAARARGPSADISERSFCYRGCTMPKFGTVAAKVIQLDWTNTTWDEDDLGTVSAEQQVHSPPPAVNLPPSAANSHPRPRIRGRLDLASHLG
eukprot:6385132-Pyramimonas_sp.AAC.1